MTTLKLNTLERFYSHNGQEAERIFRYTYTGELSKADNVKHTDGADCDDIQIKSARASVCKGEDIEAYLATDKAHRFAYVVADFTVAYIMDRLTYIAFVKKFATKTVESAKNGGGVKLRLKHESKAMLEWLRARA